MSSAQVPRYQEASQSRHGQLSLGLSLVRYPQDEEQHSSINKKKLDCHGAGQ